MAAAGFGQGKPTGVVMGVITVDSTRGVVNARINMKGMPEVRTDSGGRFVLRDVPAGTHEIEVRAIGLDPASFDVTVPGNDTARVQVNLDTKTPTLDSVKVKGTNKVRQRLVAEFIERRKQGFGHFADSTELAKFPFFSNVFESMTGVQRVDKVGTRLQKIYLRNGPSICVANVWIDGKNPSTTELADLSSDQLAAVEVYPSMLDAPPQYTRKGCGSVLVWTKFSWP
jgi:hypothetical protein